MALSPDQTAMLQLLLERGQGYAELATLLGAEEVEVRARARAALGELGGADPDRAVGLSDYLLGQADPIGRADAVRHLREDPDDHRLAVELVAALREMFPGAQLPRLPGEPRTKGVLRRGGAPAADRPPAARSRRLPAPTLGLDRAQRRLLAAGAAAAAVLIVVVLAITGAFGGDDGASAETTTAADTGEEIERVPLRATGGGNAEGEAAFGLATGDQPYVDLALTGLDPAPQNRTYVVWLLLSNELGYPISPIGVSEDGTFEDRFAIPTTALPLIARVRFVDISIADNRELATLIGRAQRRASQPDATVTDLLLEKPGETVLRGLVPAAGQREG